MGYKMNNKPYVKKPVIYCFNGRDYEEYTDSDYKLYEGEVLLKNAYYTDELYYALMKDGEIVMETTSYRVLEDFFNGRITMRERLLSKISYYHEHVTTHEEFDPNLPTDKAIVELYDELKDPNKWLSRFEHGVYFDNENTEVDMNMLKWLGEAISAFLYSEKDGF